MSNKYFIISKNLLINVLSLFFYITALFTSFWNPLLLSIYRILGLSEYFLFFSKGNIKLYEIYNSIFLNNIIYLFLFIFLVFLNKKYILNGFKEFKNGFLVIYKLVLDTFYLKFIEFITLMIIGTFISLPDNSANQDSLNQIINISPFFSVFPILLGGPLVEEIIFRHIICRNLYIYFKKSINLTIFRNFNKIKLSVLISSLLSGLIFGFVHVQTRGDYLAVFPYIITGVLLGIIYIRNNCNLFYIILLHTFQNLLAFLLIVSQLI